MSCGFSLLKFVSGFALWTKRVISKGFMNSYCLHLSWLESEMLFLQVEKLCWHSIKHRFKLEICWKSYFLCNPNKLRGRKISLSRIQNLWNFERVPEILTKPKIFLGIFAQGWIFWESKLNLLTEIYWECVNVLLFLFLAISTVLWAEDLYLNILTTYF